MNKKEYQKNYRELHKDKRIAYMKEYNEKNKIEIKEKKHEYYQNNKKYIIEKCKKNYQINKDEKLKFQKEYSNLHKEEIQKWRKEYNLINKKELNEISKKYYQKHKEKMLQQMKDYSKSHQEQIKEYRLKNEEHIKLLLKNWRRKNRDKINKYATDKKINDTNFRLTCALRNRIKSALKKNVKKGNSITLIGCSIEFLKDYLAVKFTSGMSWKNYGKWHIDHIRPCALFDLSKPEEQLKCFHYTNLQPLWAKDNFIKNAKYGEKTT